MTDKQCFDCEKLLIPGNFTNGNKRCKDCRNLYDKFVRDKKKEEKIKKNKVNVSTMKNILIEYEKNKISFTYSSKQQLIEILSMVIPSYNDIDECLNDKQKFENVKINPNDNLIKTITDTSQTENKEKSREEDSKKVNPKENVIDNDLLDDEYTNDLVDESAAYDNQESKSYDYIRRSINNETIKKYNKVNINSQSYINTVEKDSENYNQENPEFKKGFYLENTFATDDDDYKPNSADKFTIYASHINKQIHSNLLKYIETSFLEFMNDKYENDKSKIIGYTSIYDVATIFDRGDVKITLWGLIPIWCFEEYLKKESFYIK